MINIQVLGPGCVKCNKLFENVERAVNDLGLACEVGKITDINEITKYRVMSTPALVVDGVVKSSGKSLSVDKVKDILKHL